MLSALANYRERGRPVTFHGTLAWIAATADDFDWRKSEHYTRYFQGAKNRAAERGYKLEPFDLYTSAGSPYRLRSVFRARNITGLLICPHPNSYAGVKFPWEDFSLLTFGYSITNPTVHAVSSAHYRNTRRVLREIAARGYRRPGLVLGWDQGTIADGTIPAAYIVEQQFYNNGPKIPPFVELESNPSAFLPWLKKYRVDVILTINYLVPVIQKLPLSIPKDVAFVNLTLPSPDPIISGIVEDDNRIGSVAADLLIELINRGDRGIPSEPLRIHVEGTWNEGTTLPWK